MTTTILLAALLSAPNVFDRCDAREKAGKMLTQKFLQSKICKASKYVAEWTDCTFTAGATVIELVGAIGLDDKSRAKGLNGAGWYIRSLDTMAHTVRIFLVGDMPTVRVDAADLNKEKGCVYDTAYISMDTAVSRIPLEK